MKDGATPFTEADKKGQIKNLYEWGKDKTRFNTVTRNLNEAELAQSLPANFNQPREKIVSFYSDRNLKEPMRFKSNHDDINKPTRNSIVKNPYQYAEQTFTPENG